MKSIKGIAAILFIGMSFTQVFAQKGRNSQMENKSPEEAAKMKTEKLTKKLALTDAQIESVNGILLTSFTKRQDLHKKYPQLKAAKSEMKALRKDGKDKKKSILTESQLEQLKARKKKSGNGTQKKGASSERKSPEQRLAKMKSKIELTASQEKELLQLFNELESELNAIKAKYPELDDAKAEMKALRQETDTEMKKVLTPEQLGKYKQHKNGGKKGNKKGAKGSK